MNIKKIPGMAVGGTIGLGMSKATAKEDEDPFFKGLMFSLGGAAMGSKSKWMQELGREAKKEVVKKIKPNIIKKPQQVIPQMMPVVQKIKIPENVKKDLVKNIKKPGVTVGKITKFVGKSIAKALSGMAAKKGIIALGLL